MLESMVRRRVVGALEEVDGLRGVVVSASTVN